MVKGRGARAGIRVRGAAAGRSVFISYTTHAEADLDARERLCDILVPLCRARTLGGDPWSVWVDDRSLNAGDDWNAKLIDALNEACLFVVVMSRKYLNSPFCMDTELPLILERHVDEGVPVLGVWLDDVKRTHFVATLAGGRVMSLDERQCLPRGPEGDGLLAVRKWDDPEDAWDRVAEEIERAWPAPADVPVSRHRLVRAPVSAPARFAPFLCDRDEPRHRVIDALERWQRRPLLIVSEGRRDDCLAEWAERIVQHELVGARPEFDRGAVQFADPVVLAWPGTATEARRQWLRDLSQRYTGYATSPPSALHAAQAQAPAFWVTDHMTADMKDKDALAVLDGLVALLADWPDRAPAAMLVVVVHLVRPDGGRASRAATKFRQRLGEIDATGRVHAVWAGGLPEVREGDVRPWLSHAAVRSHLPAHEAARLVPHLGFVSTASTMPMRAFADRVHAWLDNPDSLES